MFCSMNWKETERQSFEKRDPHLPSLGTRVRRGRDWKWKEEDNYGPGTVKAYSREGVFLCILCYKIIGDFIDKC